MLDLGVSNQFFTINVFPRVSISWEEFLRQTPPFSVALDGYVLGGPRFDESTRHVNFDHHDNVVREATMSTCMQVYFALKGGLMKAFQERGHSKINIYINDTDQDTSLAAWLLVNYKLFEGCQSEPHINRLLALNDRWDITGGAFPMNISDKLIRSHTWVFQPYSCLRKSGQLAVANSDVLRDNLEAIFHRLDKFLMGEADEIDLDTRHEILFDCPEFKVVNEIGGSGARFYLFNHGMDAFISLVAKRPDGRFVYSIGRRSRYIPFPILNLYSEFNALEGFTSEKGWNGSDIVGGSSRLYGSGLTWQKLRDVGLELVRPLAA